MDSKVKRPAVVIVEILKKKEKRLQYLASDISLNISPGLLSLVLHSLSRILQVFSINEQHRLPAS